MDMVQKNLADLAEFWSENSAPDGLPTFISVAETGLFYQRRIFSAGRTSAARPARLPLGRNRFRLFASAGARPVFRFPQTTQNRAVARIDTAKSCQDILNFRDKSKAAIASNWPPKFTDWKY